MSDPREGEQLLADILAHPDDDDLRLIYADWLEDRGGPHDAGRAALIRGQIEFESLACLAAPTRGVCFDPSCRRCELDRDMAAMLDRSPARPPGASPREMAWLGRGLRHALSRRPTPKIRWGWRRGFVEAVACPLGVWLRVGGAVLEEHPVRRVTDPDRVPILENNQDPGGVCYWIAGSQDRPWMIPRAVFDLMGGLADETNNCKTYSSPQKAHDALSDRLLKAVRPSRG